VVIVVLNAILVVCLAITTAGPNIRDEARQAVLLRGPDTASRSTHALSSEAVLRAWDEARPLRVTITQAGTSLQLVRARVIPANVRDSVSSGS
jgi:hypothetical protein